MVMMVTKKPRVRLKRNLLGRALPAVDDCEIESLSGPKREQQKPLRIQTPSLMSCTKISAAFSFSASRSNHPIHSSISTLQAGKRRPFKTAAFTSRMPNSLIQAGNGHGEPGMQICPTTSTKMGGSTLSASGVALYGTAIILGCTLL